MPRPPQKHVRLHRFCDLVAFDFTETETLYISAKMARQFARQLNRITKNIEQIPFTKSSVPTVTINEDGKCTT